MWIFLAQEIMFFSGLFTCYLVYRVLYPHAFLVGSRELDWRIGAANTVVLLLSSFTMVVAVLGAKQGRRKMIVLGLLGTLLFGGIFLGVKVFEYGSKWEHHLVPGPYFEWHGDPSVGREVELFFSLYFGMTGMHALHMVIGMGIMLVMLPLAWRGKWTPQNHNFVEGFGLYWHFVDIVWIFLFPFLYLIGLSGGSSH
ncbi:MAG: cytochrome c oxidase subunit 3 family protein [Acidobacteria bacterium]|nr:MAG: cytochrome c oxidase subunit 3 family protein [Acidobacteriota bacterium]